MLRILHPVVLCLLCIVFCSACETAQVPAEATDVPSRDSIVVRVATYNIEDMRGDDLEDGYQPRLQQAARVIQEIRPDVILINEIAYDMPGAPGYVDVEGAGRNAARFAERYLAVSQGAGLEPVRYHAFMAPTNTGVPSGHDFDNNGYAVADFPPPPPGRSDGAPAPQTAAGRLYGNDSYGFGTYPGQYGMALLVRDGLEVLRDSVRTFRELPWSTMPGALRPVDPATEEPWYSDAEWADFRLSSKSHWDVPVRLPNGAVIHFLASHPTPPAFDGPEQRNVRRNHDEIRFWADYLNEAEYIVSDSGRVGGLRPGASFIILGDLNADPDEGLTHNDPVGTFLLGHPRVEGAFVPTADAATLAAYPSLEADDTALWGKRVDYVLPSSDLTVLRGRVERPVGADSLRVDVSDHFPVWVDLRVPPARLR